MQLTRTPTALRSRAIGQGHADHAALGGRVGGLADLAVEGGDRGDGDDGAALVVGERLGLGSWRWRPGGCS